MQPAEKQIHRETLEEEATHTTDEARMLLPGVQAVLGFQLVAVTNQRFVLFTPVEQALYLAAFLLLALAMGLIMAPAAYHRQAERGKVTRRFVDLSSMLLTLAMVPPDRCVLPRRLPRRPPDPRRADDVGNRCRHRRHRSGGAVVRPACDLPPSEGLIVRPRRRSPDGPAPARGR
jgi:hypothetical protein